MSNRFNLAFRPASVAAGVSVSTAIDLTSDDENDVQQVRREHHVNDVQLVPREYQGTAEELFRHERLDSDVEATRRELNDLHDAPPTLAVGRMLRSGRQRPEDNSLGLRGRLQASVSLPAFPTLSDLSGAPVPPARHSISGRRSVKKKQRVKSSGPDFVEVKGHKNMSFWKDKYFKELGLASELQLALSAAQFFEKATITTVVPNRYLNLALKTKKGNKKENMKSDFPGCVEILHAGLAVKNAYAEHTADHQDMTRLVLWTDGSAGNGNRGFAIAWRRTTETGWDRWECAGYKAIGELLDSGGMEQLAVIKALDKAADILRHRPGQFKTVAIYTDSTHALQAARIARTSIAMHTRRKAQLVRRMGAQISLHWTPGHSKVPGNELADRIAGLASHHVYRNMAEMVDLSDDDEDEWQDLEDKDS